MYCTASRCTAWRSRERPSSSQCHVLSSDQVCIELLKYVTVGTWMCVQRFEALLTSSQGCQALLWTNAIATEPKRSPDDRPQHDHILSCFDEDYSGPRFWIVAVPNETTTGVLREHARRMDFSGSCSHISPADLPHVWPGATSFTADYP